MKKARKNEKWPGRITKFKNYGSHYEIRIQSLSSITVLFGKTSLGTFACMPDFGAGCHLVEFDNERYSKDHLSGILSPIDAVTVATALRVLADEEKIKSK
jgi:hypothetical protein